MVAAGGQMSRRSRKATRGKPRAAPASPGVQAMRLAGALQALANGLPNPWDESTDYFHRFAAVLPAATKLSSENFRGALRVGARYEIDLSPADDELEGLAAAEADWGADIADGFRQLHAVMRATLTDVSL